MKRLHFIFCFILLLLMSCEYSSEDDLINDDITLPTLVNYNDNIKSIIDNNCIGCHSEPPVSGASTSLVTYQDVVNGVNNNNLIGRISALSGDPGAMPLGGPRLPQNLIDLVIQWQDDGLPEN